MGKNYSKYYRKDEEKKEEVVETPVEEAKEVEAEPVVEEPAKPEVKSYDKGIVTNCDRVRIRQRPTTNAQVIQIINKGTIVDILKHVEGWYEVKVNVAEYAYTGYIMEQYIAIVD